MFQKWLPFSRFSSIIESQTAQPVEAELPETEADVTSIATETNVPTAIPEDETELETSSVASSGKMALSYAKVNKSNSKTSNVYFQVENRYFWKWKPTFNSIFNKNSNCACFDFS